MISLEKLITLINNANQKTMSLRVNGMLTCSPRDWEKRRASLLTRCEENPDTEVVVTEFGNTLRLYVVFTGTCYDMVLSNWR